MNIFQKKSKIIFISFFILALIFLLSNYRNLNGLFFEKEKIGNAGDTINSENSHEMEFKKPYYHDIYLKDISLVGDDSSYSLMNGVVYKDGHEIKDEGDNVTRDRVLRLALFYQWMKEDPLMFSSALNENGFKESLARLEKTQNKFKEKFGWSENIFPVSFLRNYEFSSELFKTMSDAVSEEYAEKFLQSIKDTNSEYIKDADDLKNVIMRIDKNDGFWRNGYFMMSGDTYTNIEIIINDLTKIKENGLINEAMIEKLEKCLKNSIVFCERPYEMSLKPETITDQNEHSPLLLDVKELDINEKLSFSGPFKVMSACWQNKDENYLYLQTSCLNREGYCMEESHLATETYFNKLNPDYEFDRSLIEKGVEIIPQSATTPYTCMNLDYKPKIVTMDYFLKKYGDESFFQDLINSGNFEYFPDDFKKIINGGIEIERSFFNSHYTSENDFENLYNYYAYFYSLLMKNGNGEMNISYRNSLLKRILMMKEKTADFELILNRINYHLNNYFDRYNTLNVDPQEEYVYLIRNNYSITYLVFSSSAWKSDDSLEYFKKGESVKNINKPDSSVIVDYETATEKYGKENIEKWRKVAREERLKKQ